MCITACATYTLSKRSTPTTFEQACGRHHDAEADVRGVVVIMFDYHELGDKGLHHKIFQSGHKVCIPLKQIWDDMTIKMQSPVIKMEPLPRGWIGCTGDDEGIKSSSHKIPDEVQQVPEPAFHSRKQRGEGQPSPDLRRHLRDTGRFNRHEWTGSPRSDLVFVSFFLSIVAVVQNSKMDILEGNGVSFENFHCHKWQDEEKGVSIRCKLFFR